MATTSHRITCPDCKSVLKPAKPVPDGKKVKCPKCGNTFTTPGLVEEVFEVVEEADEAPREAKGMDRKGKAALKKKTGSGKPTAKKKKRYDDDDDEGGGVYSVAGGTGEEKEEDKPEINYAPDMSIKDLRGPAQASVVKPSNHMMLLGGLSALASIFLICVSFWPMVFSEHILDHEEVLEKHYKVSGDKDAATKIKGIPKDRKDLKKEDAAVVEEKEDERRTNLFILMGISIFVLIYNAIEVVGAVKMQNLESRRWGIASSIMMLLPFGTGGLSMLIGGGFYFTIGAMLFDDESMRTLYCCVLGGIVYLIAIAVGVSSLRTLMSQEVIDGFEYVAD
jgi:predicted Zn finger-like uncharacterized protein